MQKLIISILFTLGLISLNTKVEAYYYRPTTIYKPVTITPTYRYQQVRGYYKPTTGTYVNPYIRGVKNTVKYDNLNYYYYGINGRRIYPNR
jgi:hypothetical protein